MPQSVRALPLRELTLRTIMPPGSWSDFRYLETAAVAALGVLAFFAVLLWLHLCLSGPPPCPVRPGRSQL